MFTVIVIFMSLILSTNCLKENSFCLINEKHQDIKEYFDEDKYIPLIDKNSLLNEFSSRDAIILHNNSTSLINKPIIML